jgi:hypothetical protein
MKNILFMLFALILLAACSSNAKLPPRNISSFSLFNTHSYEESISKAYYDPGSKPPLDWFRPIIRSISGGMVKGGM